MKIRNYAKSIGFEVVGKLTYMGKRGLAHRWYMDEAGNNYFIDVCDGTVNIIPKAGDRKTVNEKMMSICHKCNHRSVCGFQDDTTLSCNHFQKEVTLCENCQYWTKDGNGYCDDESYCGNPNGLDNYAHADDFCSYGEVRNNE